MTDSEKLDKLLESINSINGRLDKVELHLGKVDQRLDVIDFKQDRTAKKLDDLQLDVKLSERDIRRDIHILRDEMDTVIELLKIHNIVPL